MSRPMTIDTLAKAWEEHQRSVWIVRSSRSSTTFAREEQFLFSFIFILFYFLNSISFHLIIVCLFCFLLFNLILCLLLFLFFLV